MTAVGLGIDVGLTGARAALVRADGELLGCSAAPAVATMNDARAWPGAVARAVRDAIRAAPVHDIAAIGVAAAGPQPILVDEHCEPLLPTRLTALDRRPAAERERLAAHAGVAAGELADHALPTLLWWREHEPDAFAAAAHALDATGYLVAWLTGRPAMDRITHADYVLSGIEPPLPIPVVAEPFATAGRLRPEAASELGLAAGAPVAVGTYDSWVDLESTGGESRILLGSTMVLATATVLDPGVAGDLRSVALPGGGHMLAGWTSAAGSTIAWAQERFGRDGVAELFPGAGGLVAVPYLDGERTPVWDTDARGAVVGLTGRTSSGELARAFVDAVALSARDIVERMRDLEHRPTTWRAAGGGIHDPVWLQATSDVLAAELEVVDVTSGAGAGVFGLRAAGFDPVLPITRTVAPREAACERYDRLYPLYRELYAQLRSTMAALGALEEAYQ
jgi:xylulokinase